MATVDGVWQSSYVFLSLNEQWLLLFSIGFLTVRRVNTLSHATSLTDLATASMDDTWMRLLKQTASW